MRLLNRKQSRPAPRARQARSCRRKRGQTLVEYTLILSLVAVVCIGAFALLGKQVVQMFSRITTLLDTAQTGSTSPNNN